MRFRLFLYWVQSLLMSSLIDPANQALSVAPALAKKLEKLGIRRRFDLVLHLPLRYEDMVEDQENTVRALVDFVGIDFDPACLSFHENRRYARTASYAQVTERLYDRSKFRHRKYLKQLAPVIPILRPMIERLGYEVDDA